MVNNNESKSGFTLIELLGVIVVVGIILAILIPSLGIGGAFLRSRDVGESEQMAVSHLSKLFPQAESVGASCVTRDTDGDGYLSCDGSVTLAEGQVKTFPLSCAAPWTINEGCKSRAILVPGQPATTAQ